MVQVFLHMLTLYRYFYVIFTQYLSTYRPLYLFLEILELSDL